MDDASVALLQILLFLRHALKPGNYWQRRSLEKRR